MVSHAAVGECDALEEVCETIRQRSSFQSKTKNRIIFLSGQRKSLFSSPCEDFCEDRVPHVVAHHVSFLYAKLGPQGKGLDLWCLEKRKSFENGVYGIG